jgi:hypothetical protein
MSELSLHTKIQHTQIEREREREKERESERERERIEKES